MASVSSSASRPRSAKKLEQELWRAVKAANLSAVVACVQRGANVHCRDLAGNQPLHVACGKGALDIVRYVVEAADADVLDVGYEIPPFHWAASSGNVALMEYLLSVGAVVDDVTEVMQRSALHEAAHGRHESAFNFLVQRGLDPLAKDTTGVSARDEMDHRTATGTAANNSSGKKRKAGVARTATKTRSGERYKKARENE